MNRKEFLRKLLQKTQQNQQFYKNHINYPTELQSPTPAIKRFQILHMGCCQIGLPTPHIIQNPSEEKAKSNYRKILTVQRVKSAKKKQQNPKKTDNSGVMTKEIQQFLHKQKDNFTKLSGASNYTDMLEERSKNISDKRNRVFVSKRSLTLSDSTTEAKKDQKKILKNDKNVRHIYSQSNSVFHRNYTSRKGSILKKESNKVVKDHRKEQNQTKINFRKELLKNYAKPYNPPPKITAKAYIIIEKQFNQINIDQPFRIHASQNSKNSLEVASLTKIMTCYLAIKLTEKYELQAKEEVIKIGKFQSTIGGTSAKIEPGDIYTLQDLYYGLMLPSGNDASLAIAVWGGRLLLEKDRKGDTFYLDRKYTKKECYERFIREMNTTARELKLVKTNYANSHGLVNSLNRSCAYDIAYLSHQAMQNAKFRQIVGTKEYSRTIKIETRTSFCEEEKEIEVSNRQNEEDESGSDEEVSHEEQQRKQSSPKTIFKKKDSNTFVAFQPKFIQSEREVYWENTHKLLWRKDYQYKGIKTGVTTVAGPCLSSLIRTQCGRQFYIVVLNCRKMFHRFKETEILKKWVYRREGIRLKGRANSSVSVKAENIGEESSEQQNSKNEIQENEDFND